MTVLNKPWQFWFEWAITLMLIIGVIFASFNIYPHYLYILLISNIGWVVQAVIWRKASLFVVQLVITIIYIAGIVKSFL